MLIRFWVEGYRCFKERAEIDLTDKKNYQFGKECVRGDFLDKMIILGGNNAGKTSFGYAMTDIVSTAGGFSKDIGQRNRRCFLNRDADTPFATFHYDFAHKGSVISYEYSKSSPDTIVAESLRKDRKTVFSYRLDDGSAPEFDGSAIQSSVFESIDGSESLIRVLSKTRFIDRDSPEGVILEFANHSLYYLAMWKMDVHVGVIDDHADAEKYIIENRLVNDFASFLSEVASIDIRLRADSNSLTVAMEKGDVPFKDCVSRGTMILSRMFCWIHRCKGRDALMFYDDFDDMFHYRTAENAIRRIIAGSRAQCIFVTHNTGLASNDFLRPDCCFLMDGGRIRSFSSLTDKDIRKGNNLEKMLRNGEFDSIG